MRLLELDDSLNRAGTTAVASVAFTDADCAGGEAWAVALTPAEARYAGGLRSSKRRAAFFAGRVAAKAAIGRLTSLPPERVEVLPASSGAPVVRLLGAAPPRPADVSISHTRGLAAAVAFDRRETGAMGIDVEVADQAIDPALVPFAFEAEEARWIEAAADDRGRHRRLLACWTAKEAVLKALGRGLTLPMLQVRLEPASAGELTRLRASLAAGRVGRLEFDVLLRGAHDHVLALAAEGGGRRP